MKIISVNIGKEEAIRNGKKSGTSGIFKLPMTEAVEITPLGLKGDTIIDTKHHGGADQAVYLYGSTDYDYWTETLGKTLLPGTFGENLTISDLESARFNVGDRLDMEGVILEVTAPRLPCGTLAARMDDPQFLKRFRQAERPGLYCRVIQPGWVKAGMPVSFSVYSGEIVPVLELFRSIHEADITETELRHLLAAPIDIRSRHALELRLASLSA